MDVENKSYIKMGIHFYNKDVNEFLKGVILDLKKDKKIISLIDCGCGDGADMYSLISNSLINKKDCVIGIDFSDDRIKAFSQMFPEYESIYGDVLKLSSYLRGRKFDLIISNQLIEHLNNDKKFLLECKNALKNTGHLYLSTVIRSKWGMWIYRRDNHFVIDPTHVNEYPNKEKILSLLEEVGFCIEDYEITLIKFPIIGPLYKTIVKT